MKSHPRVVITGLGVCSAVGMNRTAFWERLVQGRSAIQPINSVDVRKLKFHQGAEIQNYDPHDYFDDSTLLVMDRFAQFAKISVDEAVHHARLTPDELAGPRTAVVTGCGLGGKVAEDAYFEQFYAQGKTRFHPLIVPKLMANAPAGQMAQFYGIQGPTYTVSTACASSTHAIGQAYALIRSGLVDRALAGGSEAPFSLAHLKAWEGLRVISNDLCRPFSHQRSGMILGEGGAMLVLESLTSALARKANILVEVVGFGMSADAHHITEPNSSGQILAVQAALRDAHILPEHVHYWNAHGTGTLVNDEVEAQTIQTLFPYAKEHLQVSATKSMHGHLLGAAGAVESVATIMALQEQIVPPTAHYLGPDPKCDLPLVYNKAQPAALDYAINASFAFGGLNAILIFKRYA